jgi:hypothetical protein
MYSDSSDLKICRELDRCGWNGGVYVYRYTSTNTDWAVPASWKGKPVSFREEEGLAQVSCRQII